GVPTRTGGEGASLRTRGDGRVRGGRARSRDRNPHSAGIRHRGGALHGPSPGGPPGRARRDALAGPQRPRVAAAGSDAERADRGARCRGHARVRGQAAQRSPLGGSRRRGARNVSRIPSPSRGGVL
ncbi:MAG: hypothetical protein AVDCRST_MAG55-551, partial [uncultured Rubrobacteraceae bacterium]